MRHELREYFHYSRAERDAAIVLFLLLLLSIAIPYYCKSIFLSKDTYWEPPQQWLQLLAQAEQKGPHPDTLRTATTIIRPFDPNQSSLEALIAAGWPTPMARSVVRYREKGGYFRHVEDLKRLYLMTPQWYERLAPHCHIAHSETKQANKLQAQPHLDPVAPTPFYFDPNTVPKDSLLLVGCPPRIAENIIRYRAAGGRFRNAESLRKIYGMTDSIFIQLKPWIKIQSAPPQHVATSSNTNSPASLSAKTDTIYIDINTASLADWMQLKGIGKGYGKRILRFRKALGGFYSVEQVAETYGLPDTVFQAIRAYLHCTTPWQQLDLNTASVKQLSSHPYISQLQARGIVAWRTQHGAFTHPKEISRTGLFSPSQIRRLLPYLTCSPPSGS